jgi:hypothetical protein
MDEKKRFDVVENSDLVLKVTGVPLALPFLFFWKHPISMHITCCT